VARCTNHHFIFRYLDKVSFIFSFHSLTIVFFVSLPFSCLSPKPQFIIQHEHRELQLIAILQAQFHRYYQTVVSITTIYSTLNLFLMAVSVSTATFIGEPNFQASHIGHIRVYGRRLEHYQGFKRWRLLADLVKIEEKKIKYKAI